MTVVLNEWPLRNYSLCGPESQVGFLECHRTVRGDGSLHLSVRHSERCLTFHRQELVSTGWCLTLLERLDFFSMHPVDMHAVEGDVLGAQVTKGQTEWSHCAVHISRNSTDN